MTKIGDFSSQGEIIEDSQKKKRKKSEMGYTERVGGRSERERGRVRERAKRLVTRAGISSVLEENQALKQADRSHCLCYQFILYLSCVTHTPQDTSRSQPTQGGKDRQQK